MTLKILAVTLGVLVLVVQGVVRGTWRQMAIITAVGTATGVLYTIPMAFYILEKWHLLRLVFSSRRLFLDPLLSILLWIGVGWAISWMAFGCLALLQSVARIVRKIFGCRESTTRPDSVNWGHTVVFLASVACAIILVRIAERSLCLALLRHYDQLFVKAERGAITPPSPLERWFFILQYGYSYELVDRWQSPEAFLHIYEACRDRSVRLGLLKHEVFKFKYVRVSSRAGQIFRAAIRTFPESIIQGPNWIPGNDFVLEVWAPPDEIPKWEQFVREHDVPCDAEDGGPGPRVE